MILKQLWPCDARMIRQLRGWFEVVFLVRYPAFSLPASHGDEQHDQKDERDRVEQE